MEKNYPILTRDNLIEVLLKNRNIELTAESSQAFWEPTWEDAHDPFLFPWMQAAVERILQARDNKERVVVFGDYDVDGVSSTAMLVRFFAEIGIQISYRLPHRIKDGYGMKSYFMDELAERGVTLVISVDCGTRDVAVVAHAKTLGIDIIITDHHAVPEIVPEWVIALLNPKLPGSTYPFSQLAGAGVAWKLLTAVASRVFDAKKAREISQSYLDHACLGTIADCVPLIGENRTIAALGLRQLKNSKSHGIRRLIDGKSTESADVVGFHIGPRINAAGRMDSPYKALAMLLNADERLDETMAEIESFNEQRKLTTQAFAMHAVESVDSSHPVTLYLSDEIEHGVMGLVASRLVEAFGKPAIAMRREGIKIVGSCRSIEGCDITGLLESMRELFTAFGGHKQAAGFTLPAERFDEFQSRLMAGAQLSQWQPIEPGRDRGKVDGILSIDVLSLDLVEQINTLRPFGIGNPKPRFLDDAFLIRWVSTFGENKKHLGLDTSSSDIRAIAFGEGERASTLVPGEMISVEYEVDIDEWRGKKRVSVMVRKIL